MKSQIIYEFITLTCIKDVKRLENYVDFCLSKSQAVKIPGVTSSHHI